MPRHIRVWKAILVWFIAAIPFFLGLVVTFGAAVSNNVSGVFLGLGMMTFGLIMASINKLVFRARTKQLEIDYRERIRDYIGIVCPNCGQRLSEGSKFCNRCSYKVD